MSDTKETNGNKVNDERRKIVRNLLTGAGVTSGVGAVAGSAWMEPVINTIVLPAHAQTTEDTAAGTPTATTTPDPTEARCCPYYFDAGQSWCYDDGAGQNGNTGPVPGGFSVYNWDQPDNCPVPQD